VTSTEIAKKINDGLYLEGRNPFTIAGAAVLLCVKHSKEKDLNVTTDEIANAA